jgi:transcriptional regulator with GAF, ATPase, and Fis domain
MADNGTLCFDEVGALSPGAQAKVLSVTESMAFRRIGGTRDLKASARIIAMTKKDLLKEVGRGAFRQDLLHRLDVFPMELPPLRGRAGDVLALAEHFVRLFGERMQRPNLTLANEAKEILLGYPYPGNALELRNIMERAVILTSGTTIEPKAIVLRSERDSSNPFFEIRLDDSGQPPTYETVGNAYIDRIVRFATGNRSQAARLLGLSYPTVIKKLEEHAAASKIQK